MTTMPESTRVEFELMCHKTSEIHAEWQMFRHLFADHPRHLDLFNKVDSDYFVRIHQLFLEHFCMYLCRMGDPGVQHKGRNLTLETLANLVTQENPSFEDPIRSLLEEFRTSIQVFRDLRNKIYGHTDYDRSFDRTKKLFSRKEMEAALGLLRKFMNKVREAFGMPTMLYEGVVTSSNGEGLISALEIATSLAAQST